MSKEEETKPLVEDTDKKDKNKMPVWHEQQELILKTRNLKIVKIMIMIMSIIVKKTVIMQKIGLGSNL